MIDYEQYPLKFDALQKGDFLEAGELEVVFGVSVAEDKYVFALLNLQQQIQNKTGFTVRIEKKYNLRILTDAEASVHNAKVQKRFVRGAVRRHTLLQSVDVLQLTASESRLHERHLEISGLLVLKIGEARKRIVSAARPEVPRFNELTEGDK